MRSRGETDRCNIEGLGMTVETPHMASLRKKLAARKGKKEYAKNCEQIEAELSRLEKCQGLDL
jgi:hypothetical protein